MNKKLKLAIPFAVLALSCGVAAGCAGCNPEEEEHVHSYTQWAHDDTYHWKVCPEDGAIDESSKEEHVFIAGECDDCGATQTPVEELKYGTASGEIKLHKLGEYVTDFTGVTIDMGDDDVETEINTTTGAFTIENAVVGRNYTLTIAKSGYKSYSTTVSVIEGEDTHLGGSRGCILEYEVFGLLEGWDSEYHDLSHVNDEDHYIGFNANDGNKTLNVLSKDSYTQVAATLKIKYNNSVNSLHTQGIILKFEDGKHLIVRYHNGDQVNGNIQYCNEAWSCAKANSLFGEDADLNEWGENAVHTLLSSETAAIKEDGLDLTLILKDGALYTFFADKFVAKYDLPEGYADSKKVQIGYFAWNTASDAVFNYDITETIPANMQSTLNINVTNPSDGTVCTVTAAPQKDVYDLNEDVELTFTAPEGYRLDALTVGGENMIDEVLNGKLTIQANMFTLDVLATFVKEQPIALDLTIKGKKLGTTTAALADGTTVTFKNTGYTFTVTGGKISAESVVKGRYIVQVDGYLEQEIVFDETLTEVTLEYDLMENLTIAWGWGDNSNLAEQNDGKLTQVSGETQWVSSKDSYDSVAITANLVSGGSRQGVFIRFKGDSYANDKYVMIQKENNEKVSWNGESNLWGYGSNLCGETWTAYVDPLTDADLAKIAAGEYELTLVRDRNKIHVFINGELYDTKTLDESYADMKCYVGVYCIKIPSGAQRSFRIEDASEYLTDVTITDNTAEDAHGSISGIPTTKVKMGATVTLTVNPDSGYKLSSLTVNGDDVTAQMQGSTYDLVVKGDTTVVAVFTEVIPGSVKAAIKGTKLGTTAPFAEGTTVKLTCQGMADVEVQVTATGLEISSIPAGEWTVNVQGYLPVQITVANETEYSQEIVLEYDLFKIVRWDEEGHNLDHVNDATPYVEWVQKTSMNVVSKECWLGDASVSVTIKGSQTTNGNNEQGLILVFEDGKAAILNINTSDPLRLQFRPELFSDENDASIGLRTAFTKEGVAYKDVWVEFKNVTAEELTKYNSDTGIVLTVARKGNLLYVFIDGTYHGTATLPEEYADDKMGFGLFAFDAVVGAKWYYEVSETLPDLSVALTDATAENANGTIEISENVTLGETVTITVKPAQGYMLDMITATDKDSNAVTLTAENDNTYTFVAMKQNYTVTATFKGVPATQAETSVTGIGLGAAAVDMNGKEITFKAASGTETKLTVAEDKVKGVLAAGAYTVSCEGFYDLTATVEEDGSFATDTALAFEKIIFAYNLINEPEANLNDKTNVGDSTAAASDGIIKATADGRIYEWSTEQYKDVAITVTLKSGNGNQGLIMRFNGQQKDVRVRFENTKAQWIGGGWWWGTWNIIDTWDFGTTTDYANPMSEALLAKYNGEGLTLTLVRKGGVVYALVDGEVYAAQIISDYATCDVRLSVFAEDVKSGYEIPFVISTDVDAILNAAKDTHNVLGVLGNWTVTDTTLSVNGNGYAEFAPTETTTKESLKVKIAAKNSSSGNHTQGLLYRFDNGKWLAARIESNDSSSYIQYSEDALLPSSGGFIKGWTLVHNLTEVEKTAFNGDGIDLQLVRDGKYIYILLGENVIDKVILSDEYATMDGVIAATVEGGTGTAYAYEYKTGENVVVPQVYAVTASVDGTAHGYNVSVDKSLAKNGDSVTVTITASQNWWPDGVWSYFPTAIVVDGQETALTTNDLTSIEANRCSYTYMIANVTADTTIQFKVTQLDCIQGLVKVSVDGEGGTAISDSGENGYHWNDGCDVYITPAENYEIESITITRGENGTPVVITEGWGTADANGKYTYTVSGGITEQNTIVVKFKAKTTETTTPEGGDAGDTTTDTSAE